jgi:hypothetical protein
MRLTLPLAVVHALTLKHRLPLDEGFSSGREHRTNVSGIGRRKRNGLPQLSAYVREAHWRAAHRSPGQGKRRGSRRMPACWHYSDGPGWDRTNDLGIKSLAGAAARDCVWLKEPARLSIHSCTKLQGTAGHGDKPVLRFVLRVRSPPGIAQPVRREVSTSSGGIAARR